MSRAVILSLLATPSLAKQRYATGFIEDPAYHASLEKLPMPIDDAPPPQKVVDWRAQGAVTPIKDQGQCGSCWAFSTTGVIEGAVKLATGELKSLSEQELMDCSHNGNMGCNGGFPAKAAAWVVDNGGIAREVHYDHYDAADWRCDVNKSAVKDSHIAKVYAVDDNEDAMLAAVAKQPVSVAIVAEVLQTYQGGLVDEGCSGRVDHAVLVVGYNTSTFDNQRAPRDYWIVKNSWGTKWGEEGYFYLARGQNALCVNRNAVVVTQGIGPPAPPPPPLTPKKCGTWSKTTCSGTESCCCKKRGVLSPVCKEWQCCGLGLFCVSSATNAEERTCGKRDD